MTANAKVHIAVFASGSGTNAENIIRHFKGREEAEVKLLLCNKKEAPVIAKAINLDVPVLLVNREEWQNADYLLNMMESYRIDFIVLAGFLWLVPEALIKRYPGRIINIHPALLPKYGGKGMYGAKVHEAVKQNMEKQTGISIHYVDPNYDEGQLIFQEACAIDPETNSIDDIASRVHALEYAHYPRVIEELVRKSGPLQR